MTTAKNSMMSKKMNIYFKRSDGDDAEFWAKIEWWVQRVVYSNSWDRSHLVNTTIWPGSREIMYGVERSTGLVF